MCIPQEHDVLREPRGSHGTPGMRVLLTLKDIKNGVDGGSAALWQCPRWASLGEFLCGSHTRGGIGLTLPLPRDGRLLGTRGAHTKFPLSFPVLTPDWSSHAKYKRSYHHSLEH